MRGVGEGVGVDGVAGGPAWPVGSVWSAAWRWADVRPGGHPDSHSLPSFVARWACSPCPSPLASTPPNGSRWAPSTSPRREGMGVWVGGDSRAWRAVWPAARGAGAVGGRRARPARHSPLSPATQPSPTLADRGRPVLVARPGRACVRGRAGGPHPAPGVRADRLLPARPRQERRRVPGKRVWGCFGGTWVTEGASTAGAQRLAARPTAHLPRSPFRLAPSRSWCLACWLPAWPLVTTTRRRPRRRRGCDEGGWPRWGSARWGGGAWVRAATTTSAGACRPAHAAPQCRRHRRPGFHAAGRVRARARRPRRAASARWAHQRRSSTFWRARAGMAGRRDIRVTPDVILGSLYLPVFRGGRAGWALQRRGIRARPVPPRRALGLMEAPPTHCTCTPLKTPQAGPACSDAAPRLPGSPAAPGPCCLTLNDLPHDVLAHVFRLAGLHTAPGGWAGSGQGGGERAGCARAGGGAGWRAGRGGQAGGCSAAVTLARPAPHTLTLLRHPITLTSHTPARPPGVRVSVVARCARAA